MVERGQGIYCQRKAQWVMDRFGPPQGRLAQTVSRKLAKNARENNNRNFVKFSQNSQWFHDAQVAILQLKKLLAKLNE